ncbi:MAG: hypothetical protein KatS3mg110_4618 [Pirellulaceae bacterium]|nr:MAG: hypothetical protein KatS3mg110_4618 [Pirellulaceae bacterium]
MLRQLARLIAVFFWSGSLFVALGDPASGQAPTINAIAPRVWQTGSTVEITVNGAGLSEPSVMLVGEHRIAPKQLLEAQPGRVRLVLELPGDLPAGVYPAWLATKNGISSPTAVRLTSLPVYRWSDEVPSLPAVLEGRLTGSTLLRARFPGRQGQRLFVEIESRRWASKLRPVVRILDPRGTQIVYDQGSLARSGDARCQVVLPQDGTYTIVLHDLVYRGENPGDFALFIGELDWAEAAYPLAIQRGSERSFRLVGGSLDGHEVSLRIPADEWRPFLRLFPNSSHFAGEPFPVAVTADAHWGEDELTGDPRAFPGLPGGVSGILDQAGQVDRYALPVSANTEVRVECFAERVGSPIDAVLVVQTPDGRMLARGDDQPGTPDPVVEFKVPDNTSYVHVSVSDVTGRGGTGCVYRLAVELKSRPRVGLSTDADRVVIPQGGSTLIAVDAARQAYDGAVALQWHGLPDGVKVSGSLVAPGNNKALLVLSADTPIEPQVTFITGHLEQADAESGVVLAKDQFVARHHPWTQWFIAVGPGEPAPLRLLWLPGEDDRLKQGATLAAKVRLERTGAASQKVRLRLVSSQPMPRKKVKENNQEKEVDDIERALRLESDTELMLTGEPIETTVNIVVPKDLPEHPWTLVLAADLLGDDGKTVLSTAYSEARVLGF